MPSLDLASILVTAVTVAAQDAAAHTTDVAAHTTDVAAHTTDVAAHTTDVAAHTSAPEPDPQMQAAFAAVDLCIEYARRSFVFHDRIVKLVRKRYGTEYDIVTSLDITKALMRDSLQALINDDCGIGSTVDTPFLYILRVVEAGVSYCREDDAEIVNVTIAAAVVTGFGL